MQMKRFTFLLLSLLCCTTVMQAQSKSLFVTFNDGSKVEFALSTTPTVTMADDKLNVTTTETTATYELWTVTTFTYGATTNIRHTEAQHFSLENDRLIVDGTNNKVTAFAIDGKAMSLSSINIGGQTVIPLNTLTKGVYIIHINGKSIKITRR